MSIEVFNRYEKKYFVTADQLPYVRERISEYMYLDEHNKDDQMYTICNIYYDTPNNDIVTRSIQRPEYKEKLRLRSYGTPSLDDKVFIEIKKKYEGLVNKRRSTILLKDAYDFIDTGKIGEMKPFMNRQILEEIGYMLSIHEIVPAMFLAYDRLAYFDKSDDDFRLTFDANIRTRRDDLRLEHGSRGSLLLDKDTYIMEIKAVNAVPLWFAKLLSDFRLYPISFSKYGTRFLKEIAQ